MGDYLFRLGHCLSLARARRAVLKVPPSHFKTLGTETAWFDFRDGGEVVRSVGDFTESLDRRWRVEELDVQLRGEDETWSLGSDAWSSLLRQSVRPLIRNDEHHRFEQGTLVIHLRAGDVFRTGGANLECGSPPVSWYRRVIEDGQYDEVLVVTQSEVGEPGGLHPALAPLQGEYPHLKVYCGSEEENFHTLRNARHLALSPGTFSVCAAVLSENLRRLHIPELQGVGDSILTNHVFRPWTGFRGKIYRWQIEDYDVGRDWMFSKEQQGAVLEHPVNKVTFLISPRVPLDDDLVVRRAGRWKSRTVDSGLELIDPDRRIGKTLNISARAIWDLSDGRRSVKEIESYLLSSIPEAEAEIHRQVRPAMIEMIDEGLLGQPKIFGVGLSRTGTKSMAEAFRLLGLQAAHLPPYRIIDRHAFIPSNVVARNSAFNDISVSANFRDLDRCYPGSRFILTTRPLEGWMAKARRFFSRGRGQKVRPLVYGSALFDESGYREAWLRHHDDVRTYFEDRPEDLLIFDVFEGHGWPELCRFLGLPEPSEPYPHLV